MTELNFRSPLISDWSIAQTDLSHNSHKITLNDTPDQSLYTVQQGRYYFEKFFGCVVFI
jgi:hypothetical protein